MALVCKMDFYLFGANHHLTQHWLWWIWDVHIRESVFFKNHHLQGSNQLSPRTNSMTLCGGKELSSSYDLCQYLNPFRLFLWCFVAFTCAQFDRKCSRHLYMIWVWKYTYLKLQLHLLTANDLTRLAQVNGLWYNHFIYNSVLLWFDRVYWRVSEFRNWVSIGLHRGLATSQGRGLLNFRSTISP